MRPVPVVVVEAPGKVGIPLIGTPVGVSIGPLAQKGADEAF